MADVEDEKNNGEKSSDNKAGPDVDFKIGAAVANKTKRIESKFEERFGGLETKFDQLLEKLSPQPKKEKDNDKTSTTSNEVADLRAKIDRLERRDKKNTETMRKAETHLSVQKMLKGKVVEKWEDLAVKDILSGVTYSRDGVPQMKNHDGETVSLSEGIEEGWLREESNKRFLKAPAAPAPVARNAIPSVALPSVNSEKIDELDFDQCIDAAVADIQQQQQERDS